MVQSLFQNMAKNEEQNICIDNLSRHILKNARKFLYPVF